MHRIEVGRPLRPGLTRLPESAQYIYDAGGHSLLLWLARPSQAEDKAVKSGRVEVALLELPEAPDALWLLYSLEGPGGRGIPWSDAPYSWHLVPEDRRATPGMLTEAPQRALLQIILCDASTAIVQALRVVTLSPEMSGALHDAILQQSVRPWPGRSAYDRQLEVAYRRYPTTEAMLAAAAYRCEGGA